MKQLRVSSGVKCDSSSRALGPMCGEKCKFQCKVFTPQQRQEIQDSVWSGVDGTVHTRREFLWSNIEVTEVQRRRHGPRRLTRREPTHSASYHLPQDGHRKRVCLFFFSGTVGYSQSAVMKTAKQKFGKKTPTSRSKKASGGHNKIPKAARAEVRMHIKSFPTVDSHYVRENSKAKRLEPHLTIPLMYEIYVDWKKDQPRPAPPQVSLDSYKKIFDRKFNWRTVRRLLCSTAE